MAEHWLIQQVWEKGTIVPGNDPNIWRQDACGAWIMRSAYSNRGSQYGWEIDHIQSVDHGGPDALSNLRPLQWKNNASKGNGRLGCAVTARGENNVPV